MYESSRNMKGLYDKHDGEEFITDKSKWDEDYITKLKKDIQKNFSNERLKHMKDVAKYLKT